MSFFCPFGVLLTNLNSDFFSLAFFSLAFLPSPPLAHAAFRAALSDLSFLPLFFSSFFRAAARVRMVRVSGG